MLPLPVLEDVGGGRIVLRDDLLPGGTKRRVLAAVLASVDAHECVYAGPVQGYAQVAMAYACRDAGRAATLFVAKRKEPTALTLEAAQAGAKVVQVAPGYLSNVRAKAAGYCAVYGGHLFELGFAGAAFHDALVAFAVALAIPPPQVWVAAGTGSLARALCDAWPKTEVHAVQVGGTPDIGRSIAHVASERFEQDAKHPPPFPSARSYDAKVWQFFEAQAVPGALYWNVGA